VKNEADQPDGKGSNMALLKLVKRRLIRHWRINLVLLAGLTLAAGFLASLPSYAETTAAATLYQALDYSSIQGRNLNVFGPSGVMTGQLSNEIRQALGELTTDRIEVRYFQTETSTTAEKQVIARDDGERLYYNYISAWSFDRMTEMLQIVEGDWPKHGAEPPPLRDFDPPTYQVALAVNTAAESGFKIGDILLDQDRVRYKIVGVFEPREPENPLWWQDTRPFNLWREPGLNEDTIFLSVLLPMGSMREVYSGEVKWRFLVDQTLINPDNAQAIEEQLINVRTQVDAAGATLESNLPNLLGQYRQDLSRVRSILYLLSAQALAFVLYTLTVFASLANQQSEGEIVTLTSRGASPSTITLTFALDRLLLAVLAGAGGGPLLAMGGLRLWAHLTGEPVSSGLPIESYLLAAVGAGLGWLALVLPVIPAARRSLLDWQRQRARPETQTSWQKHYVDIFVLVLGGLAYWQLSTRGSFLFSRAQNTAFADPLLLLGPTLLLIGLGLVFLRIFPYILRGFVWGARATRGLVAKLGLARLARSPINASQIILLISMAVGLSLFAVIFSDSLVTAQAEIAQYRAGADLRIIQRGESLEQITQTPGVIKAVPVFRANFQRLDGNNISLLAVPADSFAQVTGYPKGMSNLTIERIMRVIRWSPQDSEEAQTPSPSPTPGEFLPNPYVRQPQGQQKTYPAVFSLGGLPAGSQIGDVIAVLYRGQQLNLEVRGMIVDFPTADSRYVVIDRTALEDGYDLSKIQDVFSHEVWLKIDPEAANDLVDQFTGEKRLLADAQQELRDLSTNANAWGILRAFTLNAMVLIVLSVAGFLLVSYFNARQRTYEFGVLRAEGLSSTQLAALLVGEGLIILFLGFAAGTGIGYGLAQTMRIYLTQILSQVLPGIYVHQLVFDPSAILRVYATLAVFYTVALLLLLVSLLRSGIQRILRIGEE
jgi:putative ABC transport system permease protein